jgi:hypothetical protein
MRDRHIRALLEYRAGMMEEGSLLAGCRLPQPVEVPEDAPEFDTVCATGTGRFPLGELGMNGPHPLTHEAIDEAMSRTSPGNYALGYMDGETFLVFYVGRSDFDVTLRLHRWVDLPSQCGRYASSAGAAWGSRRGRLLPLDAPAVGRIGACADTRYTHFAYSYARSAEAALEKEYRNFDDFGGCNALDNQSEPISAAGPP